MKVNNLVSTNAMETKPSLWKRQGQIENFCFCHGRTSVHLIINYWNT